MIEYLAVTLTALAGVVSFFYARKDQPLSSITPLGGLLVCLILFGAALGWQQVTNQQAAQRENAIENERLTQNEKRNQTLLMMSFVELDKPFETVGFSMNITYVDNGVGDYVHPYDDETLGTFPTNAVGPDEEIARFQFGVPEMEDHIYSFKKRGKKIGIARFTQMVPKKEDEQVVAMNKEWGSAEVGEGPWGFEALATAFGQFSQAFNLDETALAGEYLGRISQSSENDAVGYLTFRNQNSNNRLRELIEDHSNSHLYFAQSYKNALKDKCERSIYVNLEFKELPKLKSMWPEQIYNSYKDFSDCSPLDLCYLIFMRQPINVQPCEFSII